MICPSCNSNDSCFVVDSRLLSNSRRRRYHCEDCKSKFTTYEVAAEVYERLTLSVNAASVDYVITALQTIKRQFSNGSSKNRV